MSSCWLTADRSQLISRRWAHSRRRDGDSAQERRTTKLKADRRPV